ncbi:MAG: carotenoid biosynthesis protein [Chitinophagales bacterium]|nr:carotenoid biosynthesis protein [Chitinophagales bacterium]
MKNKSLAIILILIILHLVGLFGLNSEDWRTVFRKLIPVNILITTVLVFAFHRNWNTKFIILPIVTILTGFISEVIGVQSGLLFGDYFYEENLGPKIFGVPIILGLNWLLLIYCSRITANFLLNNPLLQALTASFLMVLLDLFLEPFAIFHDMWEWEQVTVPLKNYISWFGVALIIQLLFNRIKIDVNNVAIAAYVVMLSFFILNLYFV